MSKLLLRIFFIIPALAELLMILSAFSDRSLPQPAQDYLQWFINQPLVGFPWLLNKLALVGMVGVFVSTVGLLLFYPAARYIYVVSVLLLLPEQFTALPTLVTGWENILDNLAQLVIGLNIGLIYSLPGRNYFKPLDQSLGTVR